MVDKNGRKTFCLLRVIEKKEGKNREEESNEQKSQAPKTLKTVMEKLDDDLFLQLWKLFGKSDMKELIQFTPPAGFLAGMFLFGVGEEVGGMIISKTH